jgi:hypothetical protein
MSEASQIRREDLTLIVSSGALKAVSARCAENRRRLVGNALACLVLAAVCVASAAVGLNSGDAAGEQWLVFVTGPGALVLVWLLARLGASLWRQAALHRVRADHERDLASVPARRDTP